MTQPPEEDVVFEPNGNAVRREAVKWLLGPSARVDEVLAAYATASGRRCSVPRRLLGVVVQLDISNIASLEDVHTGVIGALFAAGIEVDAMGMKVGGQNVVVERFFARPPLDELIATWLNLSDHGCSIPSYVLEQLVDDDVLSREARCEASNGRLVFLHVRPQGFFARIGLLGGDVLDGYTSSRQLIEHLLREGLLRVTVYRRGDSIDRLFLMRGTPRSAQRML